MKHSLRCLPSARRHGFLGLLAVLASASALQAQTTPNTIYALGTVTADYTVQVSASASVTYPKGSQLLAPINPTNASAVTNFQSLPTIIAGLASGQLVVGLDVRPTTGGLYALGLNPSLSSGNAQLYTLAVTTASTPTTIGTATLTPVGSAFTLNATDPDTQHSNTTGLIPNVGFDFNPRVDRLRIVLPNGSNYRLNPNNGALLTDTPLSYTANNSGVTPPSTPYVGTAAYTNSQLGVSGTTLYDIDVTANNAVLSTQAPPNAGQLNPVAKTSFYLTGSTSPGPYGISSPTIGLGLDIYYGGGANSAYLSEARATSATSTNSYTSNLYSFDLATGRATLLYNIAGRVSVFFSDIAVALPPPVTWTGTVSNAWNDGSNWSTGNVPGTGDNVFIPGPSSTVKFQPIINNAQAVNSVTLGNGSVLTTANGGTLSLTGNFVNNDGTVAGTGSGLVALVGTAQQEIAGGASSNFRNLSVGSAGAFTSAPVSVEAGLTLTGGLTVTGQGLTLVSNSTTGTAYVVNNGGTVTGTATVQRYIDGSLNSGAGYRFYSAPVTNTTLGDLATATYSPVFNTAYNTSTTPGTTNPFPTVYGYSQQQYENSPAVTINTDFERGYYSPSSGDAWTPGTGYTVNIPASEIVDFVGTLANGDISTAAQGRSSKANAGWQLLGNPYPSALNWDQVATTGLSNVDNAVFISKSSGQYAGTYSAYVNGVGTNGGTNVIPLGQGFFVRTSSTGGSGSLNFKNSQRITTATTGALQRSTADARPQLLLELASGTGASQAAIYFEAGATTGYDKAYDAAALPFQNGLTLASEAGADLLAINGLPALMGTTTVPLQVAVATAGTYTLRVADLANLPAGYHAYLRDASQNTYTDLAATPSATVSLAAGSAAGRFALVFGTNAPLATAPATLAALVSVYPNPARGTAVLVLPSALRGQGSSQLDVLNSLGQSVLRRTIAPGGSDQVVLPLGSLASGTYTVRAVTANGSVARQLVVE